MAWGISSITPPLTTPTPATTVASTASTAANRMRNVGVGGNYGNQLGMTSFSTSAPAAATPFQANNSYLAPGLSAQDQAKIKAINEGGSGGLMRYLQSSGYFGNQNQGQNSFLNTLKQFQGGTQPSTAPIDYGAKARELGLQYNASGLNPNLANANPAQSNYVPLTPAQKDRQLFNQDAVNSFSKIFNSTTPILNNANNNFLSWLQNPNKMITPEQQAKNDQYSSGQ